jgi:hypothetical protein
LHDTRRYSMSPDAIGIPGTLYLYRARVRIVAGRFESQHDRLKEPHTSSVLPEHRAERIAAVSGKRGRRYLKRQDILDLGPTALDYMTELVHRRPRLWIDDIDTLHDLLQLYGADALRDAMGRALKDQTFGAEYVTHVLCEGDSQRSLPL